MLNEQLGFLDIPSLGLPADVDLPKLLALTIALHDIGKPYAVQRGNKDYQHEETPPIMARVLRYFGRNENEIAIACALISQDAVGEASRGWSTLPTATARQEIQHAFARTPIRSPEAAFRLQSFFYTIDCGSYPDLRRSEFNNVGGRLVSKSPGFAALAQNYGVSVS